MALSVFVISGHLVVGSTPTTGPGLGRSERVTYGPIRDIGAIENRAFRTPVFNSAWRLHVYARLWARCNGTEQSARPPPQDFAIDRLKLDKLDGRLSASTSSIYSSSEATEDALDALYRPLDQVAVEVAIFTCRWIWHSRDTSASRA